MALNYKQGDGFIRIFQTQDNYVRWYSVLLQLAMDGNISGIKKMEMPQPFINLVPDQSLDLFSNIQLESLSAKNAKLLASARSMIECAEGGDVDALREACSAYSNAFEVFNVEVCSFRQSVFFEERGYDQLSGLKNEKMMRQELRTELERLSRHGQNFSLALAQIDDFEVIKEHCAESEIYEYIKMAGDAVIECLRPFDDAYYAGENEFILCLKQTDVSGGVKAFQRFEEYLEGRKMMYEVDGESRMLSMSCCVAEPLADDDIDDLLDNLRKDIGSIEQTQGTAFAYHEMSPLQRYIKSQ